ncbi:2OG-Fe(II) oxygenase [Hyphomonas sp.]|jgi:hypothetical protein|uniref:2OG-Fe(II) oxygenase n=1 Tax=Hyphomonas sp. TaxID=87 RepID=UPI000C94F6D1|nr:2OG-Fe(II) oxygenase [Hyphomonas sp.]MAL47046.1 2OG-Fe(II) oxygenase [Hyphomonas sp.]|tara:strand:+ start:1147 stop:1740 length:594 start_codon:yes stop_codon:yes gene_type:complete
MKEYKLPYESFVAGYMAPKKLCDDIVKYYKNNKEKQYVGTVATFQVLKDVKESTDIMIQPEDTFEPFGAYRDHLQKCIEAYQKKYTAVGMYARFNVAQPYLIQHYPKGGGFKIWHFENAGYPQIVKRKIVFMTYLNDAPNAGTEFKYQKLKTPCKKGLTLIWPAEFTHTHRGVISKTHEKTIITGWFEVVWQQKYTI